ncbi:xaa-Arg dipeptidase-like [Haemaphysalis longicornis]
MQTDDARTIAEGAIAAKSEEINSLGRFLWENPEIAFQEHQAHDRLCTFLENEGFNVKRHYVLDTAFRAECGAGSPVVALLCEYDALPGLGHGCGHNLIAESALAAAVALRNLLRRHEELLGTTPEGKVVVLGTPAEEGGMGKEFLLKAGAFEGVDAALMAHPGKSGCLRLLLAAKCTLSALFEWGEDPEDVGEEPRVMDAAVLGYANLSLLRERLDPECRIHGIVITSEAKSATEVLRSRLVFNVRAPSTEQLVRLRRDFEACMKAAATASGCKVTVSEVVALCKSMKFNEPLLKLFCRHANEYGFSFSDAEDAIPRTTGGTSDAANVSHEVPTIHPLYRIDSALVNHTAEFCRAAGTKDSQDKALDIGKALALCTYDLFCDKSLVGCVWEAFRCPTKYHKKIPDSKE